MYIKKLIGSKCYLSPINIEDSPIFARWFNDQEIIQHTHVVYESISIEKEKELLLSSCKDHDYGIIDITNDNLIGNCALFNINSIYKTAEIAIVIGEKSLWNKGYGSEAMYLLINYAFNILNIENILLNVSSENKNGIHCYEKIGFKKIGERRNAIRRNRTFYNSIMMDIIPEDLTR